MENKFVCIVARDDEPDHMGSVLAGATAKAQKFAKEEVDWETRLIALGHETASQTTWEVCSLVRRRRPRRLLRRK